ncbi:MAG: hypothetical protein CMJ46_15330 [Planctomyces sp.]|nr:hypothetical protein [Planctomyces sp.]
MIDIIEKSEFARESEMQAPVWRWLESEGLMVKPEVSLPWGICDLVGCELDPEHSRKRLQSTSSRTVSSRRAVNILTELPHERSRRSKELREVAAVFEGYLTTEEVESELLKLVAQQFAVQTRTGRFKRTFDYALERHRLVCVELKLSRILEVCYQAKENKQLTNESYVALPLHTARRVSATRPEELSKSGLGLLGVTTTSCVELVAPFQSPHIQPSHVTQLHCIELFWRQFVKGRRASASRQLVMG